jgi:hypothetical protein
MSKPSPPPAPDYAGAAKQQGQDNLAAARTTTQLNRPNEVTPWGSQTWSQTPGAGPDQWTSTISLDPSQQGLLDSSNRISQNLSNVGEQGLGRVGQSMATPFDMSGVGPLAKSLDTSNLPALPGVNDFSADRDAVTNSIMSRYNTDYGRNMESAKQSLANQGITPGSDAWQRQMDDLTRQHNDQENQAILAGGQEQSRLFGLGSQARAQQFGENAANAQFGNQARGQGIQEQSYLRQLPLNELNALRTGSQVTAPQFQQYSNAGQVAPAPSFSGALAQGQGAQQAYTNNVGGYNNFLGGLFGLGGSLLQGAGGAGGIGNLFKI